MGEVIITTHSASDSANIGFKFLWKGVDKVTRLSAINDYEKRGMKMIDLETMVKSLRPAWLREFLAKKTAHGEITYSMY